jgi:hypothetical protein
MNEVCRRLKVKCRNKCKKNWLKWLTL